MEQVEYQKLCCLVPLKTKLNMETIECTHDRYQSRRNGALDIAKQLEAIKLILHTNRIADRTKPVIN